jgi:hypothetical protein
MVDPEELQWRSKIGFVLAARAFPGKWFGRSGAVATVRGDIEALGQR